MQLKISAFERKKKKFRQINGLEEDVLF